MEQRCQTLALYLKVRGVLPQENVGDGSSRGGDSCGCKQATSLVRDPSKCGGDVPR
jgi:hypothetical protein